MNTLPTIRLYNVKSDDYIYAVAVIKWMMEHGGLPDDVGECQATIAYGGWVVCKTKTGYSIQKVNNQ